MPDDARIIRRALISVSDKTGVAEFAEFLARRQVEILATGGTAALLKERGIPLIELSEYTGHPEIMDGRVKTLHPKVHGGLLGREPADGAVMREHGIEPIDLLVVNLYPFEETVKRDASDVERCIENIDVGGPAMIRAAAKNHVRVTVVVRPEDYCLVRESIEKQGGVPFDLRERLAAEAFKMTARYDGAVSGWFGGRGVGTKDASGEVPDKLPDELPDKLILSLNKTATLRYGENPHQRAAFYQLDSGGVQAGSGGARAGRDGVRADSGSVQIASGGVQAGSGGVRADSGSVQIASGGVQVGSGGALPGAVQLMGKPLSFNNIADASLAAACVGEFEAPACVIVKHAVPCGVACAPDIVEAWQNALAADSVSAFGGIIALNRCLDGNLARNLVESQFIELIVAPEVRKEALDVLSSKPSIRVLQGQLLDSGIDIRGAAGGYLVQDEDRCTTDEKDLEVKTAREPTAEEISDLLFAWRVVKYVKSNAIVFASGGRTTGIGAGQTSRVDAVRIAARKILESAPRDTNCVMASDAFFPFEDSLAVANEHHVKAVIQPGGSKNDAAVIKAADAYGMAMVFTGTRHFRH